MLDFDSTFYALTGNLPFPWQQSLYQRFAQGKIPAACNLPTGLGKTNVIAVWLIALINQLPSVPRRLVYVVNRRTVVNQTTAEVEKIRVNLKDKLPNIPEHLRQLAVSTLRGQFADNREWSADPSRPAVICGTVDMIGSRLLFSGYGVGFKSKPLHAGFLGQDALLVHDEAHLEPAFQELLLAIQAEQERCGDFRKLRVIELTATSRGEAESFPNQEERLANEKDPTVQKRIDAKKAIVLHEISDEKKELADKIVDLAFSHKDSQKAILVFVRKVEDVAKIVNKLGNNVQQLTGTLRGLERDRMADPRRPEGCPIFARFLPRPQPDALENEQWKVEPKQGTVYLACTSAGEVGVNISADHLICDLSTFESMSQRFGRVNRFGTCPDTRIDIVHPVEFADADYELSRERTLALLKKLNGDGSPRALGGVDPLERKEAFAPTPTILPVSDILFDTWALTTIRDKLPGRPMVEPYLHGLSNELPETQVAWRNEVWEMRLRFKNEDERQEKEEEERKRLAKLAADLLEDFPLKPHELLRDRSDRVLNRLVMSKASPDTPIWIRDDQGAVEIQTLGKLREADKSYLNYKTVLLPPEAGGMRIDEGKAAGVLDAAAEFRSENRSSYDVSEEWRTEKGEKVRIRVWDDDSAPNGKDYRLIRTVDTTPDADEADDEAEVRRFWNWFELRKEGDTDGSKSNRRPVLYQVHVCDVVKKTEDIVNNLNLPEGLRKAIILAAKFHDLGKRRRLFQLILGNRDEKRLLAKSGKKGGYVGEEFRHEFGSLIDVLVGHDLEPIDEVEFKSLTPEMQQLVLHLIATHHGYARPHFPAELAFDPERDDDDAIAAEVPQRFARLQRKYGRWGLAYLESLLHAADWHASANPSHEEEL